MHLRHTLAVPLAAALLIPTTPASATPQDPAGQTPPTITQVAFPTELGGLSPYALFSNALRVTFTDDTPSAEADYRVRTLGGGLTEVTPYSHWDDSGFTGTFDDSELTDDTTYQFVVDELVDGAVVSTSDPFSFEFGYVDHPRRLGTSAKKVKGEWTYRAGRTARIRYRGSWEKGARITTQVWTSRREVFDYKDWNFNGKRALVRTTKRAPVTRFKIPRTMAGRYVWLSVVGSKQGEGSWSFRLPAMRIVK